MWFLRVIDIADRVMLALQHKAGRIPGQVFFAVLFLGELAFAVGAKVVGFLGIRGNVVMGSELEAGMFGIAVELDLAVVGFEQRREWIEVPPGRL